MKVAFVGGKTSTLGFRALGVDVFPIAKPEEAPAVWQEIDLQEYGVIFITEPIYKVLTEEIKEARRRELPVITVLPSVAESEGIGVLELGKMIEKAVGSDLLVRE